jgi:hypothetical protein
MTHFIACIAEDDSVTVLSDCEPGRVVHPPWLVVDLAGLEALKARAAASVVPTSISPRQARLWLVSHGVTLASIDEAIASITDDVTRESVRVEWEYGLEVQRSSPWLSALGAALGLDDDALDQAFREAATL